jgi:hypothetical protein
MLLGCGVDDDGPTIMMPPDETLPDGVWEPFPGANIVDARFATDGDTLWWATSRRISDPVQYVSETAVWLHATSTTGTTLRAPAQVADADVAAWSPDVLLTPTDLYVKGRNDDVVLRRFTRTGEPAGDPVVVPFPLDDTIVYTPMEAALVATPAGTARVVLPLYRENSDVAIVDFDTSGQPATTAFAGTPDTAEGGTSPTFVTAGARSDGTTLVAWDRYYNGCISSKPAVTQTTSLVGNVVAPVTALPEQPDSGAVRPVIATHGDGAFLTWQRYTVDGPRIAISQYPDVATVLGDIPGPTYSAHATALVNETRGAIATMIGDDMLVVTPFERGAQLQLGTGMQVPLVDPVYYATIVGLHYVGNDQYVVAWIETKDINAPSRLFATTIEPVTNTMRPAPPPATPAPMPDRRLRCP